MAGIYINAVFGRCICEDVANGKAVHAVGLANWLACPDGRVCTCDMRDVENGREVEVLDRVLLGCAFLVW